MASPTACPQHSRICVCQEASTQESIRSFLPLASGAGGQCTRTAVVGGRCRVHEGGSCHGDVDGRIPAEKLQAFPRAAPKLSARQVGVTDKGLL